jgi:hypothetical protein
MTVPARKEAKTVLGGSIPLGAAAHRLATSNAPPFDDVHFEISLDELVRCREACHARTDDDYLLPHALLPFRHRRLRTKTCSDITPAG